MPIVRRCHMLFALLALAASACALVPSAARAQAILEQFPSTDGAVFAFQESGSTVYVGGDFFNIGGAARSYLAALDATTGLATSWNPSANGGVYSLASLAGKL